MSLTDCIIQHSVSAVIVWSKFGELVPVMWATGRRRTVVAQLQQGGDSSDEARTQLLAAMRHAVRARFIGRCDEVWSTSEESLKGRRLAPIAEVDPRVHTGIVTVGIDCKTRVANGYVCLSRLDDNGHQGWRAAPLSEDAAYKVLHCLDLAVDHPAKQTVQVVAEAVGWHISFKEVRRA